MTASVGYTKDFKHSGLGYSKLRLGAVIVENNAVSQSSIPAATLSEQNKKISLRLSTAAGSRVPSIGHYRLRKNTEAMSSYQDGARSNNA